MIDDRLTLAAHRLAVRFADDAELPIRFRRRSPDSVKQSKGKDGSEIERKFQESVASWKQLAITMVSQLGEEQSWRFIELRPDLDRTPDRVTDNQDFCDFIDYFSLRRDEQKADPAEIGGLAQLSVALQRMVEGKLQSHRRGARR